MHVDLQALGEPHGRKRIARLMRQAGLTGASRRHGSPKTTQRDKDVQPVPDLVDRDFMASAPNQLWVADRAQLIPIVVMPANSGHEGRSIVRSTAAMLDIRQSGCAPIHRAFEATLR